MNIRVAPAHSFTTGRAIRGKFRSMLLMGLVLMLPSSDIPAEATSQSPSRLCSNVAKGADGWEAIRAPSFSKGGDDLSTYSVYGDAHVLFVTNGTIIARSDDKGCSFSEVFDLSKGLPVPIGGTIELLETGIQDVTRAYAVISDVLGRALPEVFTSNDAGISWAPINLGLPPHGRIIDLAIAPFASTTAYALVRVANQATQTYVTSNAYEWRLANALSTDATAISAALATSLTDLEVDDWDPTMVWAGSTSGLLSSRDSASTFTAVANVSVPISRVEVHSLGQPAQVIAYGEGVLFRSEDGGRHFKKIELPGNYRSAASDCKNVVVSVIDTDPSVYAYEPSAPEGWRAIVARRPAFRDLSVDNWGTFYARTSTTIMRSMDAIPPRRWRQCGWGGLVEYYRTALSLAQSGDKGTASGVNAK